MGMVQKSTSALVPAMTSKALEDDICQFDRSLQLQVKWFNQASQSWDGVCRWVLN